MEGLLVYRPTSARTERGGTSSMPIPMGPIRAVTHQYSDPLDLIWTETAERLGMRIVRSRNAYASWDGRGVLTVAPQDEFDADDCLAQIVLHEICHALVAGPMRMHLSDWGLDNTSDQHVVEEHATNRLQAALTGPYGLRRVLATTTEFRAYYDQLPADPLQPASDPAAQLASRAMHAARTGPWSRHLESALLSTHRVVKELYGRARQDSLWSQFEPLHPCGHPTSDVGGHVCGQCAWFSAEDKLCRQARYAAAAETQHTRAEQAACSLWEPLFADRDCAACGACCRTGFDCVEVSREDPVVRRHRHLVTVAGDVMFLERPGGRCVALTVEDSEKGFRCRIYAERPEPCASFAIAGDACLEARRRVGLSRAGSSR